MTDRKIGVLFVLPSLEMGGAERQVINLINGMDKERFRAHLFTFEKQLDLLADLNREGISFENKPRRYRLDFSPAREIARIIDREHIDIVHCTLQIALLFGFLGKWKAGKRVRLVAALHTTLNRDFKGDLFDWILYAPLMMFCRRVITVCQNQRIHWSRKFPFLARRFTTIHNGVDTDKFRDSLTQGEKKRLKESLGVRDDEFTAAMVAGLRPEKGHEYAFRALRILNDLGMKIKLLLIGDGERKESLQRLSRSLNVSQNLVWLGFQRNPQRFLSISDVLLVPSVAESFPMAILEALSMGKPVVASSIGGIPEVVTDGANGLLIKPGDVPSLTHSLAALVGEERLRSSLGHRARESVESRFSLSGMVQKTEALFSELLEGS